MRADIKKKWLTALRGGQYSQTTSALQNDKGYCCLGVLCDIVDPEGWEKADWDRGEDSDMWGHSGDWRTLSPSVRQAAGMPEAVVHSDICKESSSHLEEELMIMNDSGWSFSEIADWIEENIPEEA